jgi:hypothetical protein
MNLVKLERDLKQTIAPYLDEAREDGMSGADALANLMTITGILAIELCAIGLTKTQTLETMGFIYDTVTAKKVEDER